MNRSFSIVLSMMLIVAGFISPQHASGAMQHPRIARPKSTSTDCYGSIDPNPDFMSDGAVRSDLRGMADKYYKASQSEQEAWSVCGAAADGVTQVLLPLLTEGPETFDICIDNGDSKHDGGLAPLGSTAFGTCVKSVEQIEMPNTGYIFVGFAVYKVPMDFNSGADASKKERDITFNVKRTVSGVTDEYTQTLTLVRPPIVLVHGLWSSADTWRFGLVNDQRFNVTAADYSGTHASHFSTNSNVVFDSIQDAIDAMHEDKIAVTQADVLGHSMGGILTRNFISSRSYKRDDNYNQGDVHAFLTLNTPHTGSPLASALLYASYIPGVSWAARWAGAPIDEGAIEDLAKGSDAIAAIQSTDAPAHALVGVGGSELLAEVSGDLSRLPGQAGAIFRILSFFAITANYFEETQHDLIVGRRSQEGGIGSSSYSVLHGFGSIHTECTANGDYSSRAIDLLNTRLDQSEWGRFPAPSGQQNTSTAVRASIASARSSVSSVAIAAGLTITRLNGGTTVAPGGVVSIQVQPDSGVTISKTLVVAPGVAEQSLSAPFVVTFTVPTDAVGAFPVSAIAPVAGGGFVTSTALVLNVVPTATLTNLTLLPGMGYALGRGAHRPLTTLGFYSDGVTRDLTPGSSGTVYSITNANPPTVTVATVSADGVVTGNNAGRAIAVATNGSRSVTTTITVVNVSNTAPFAEAPARVSASVGKLARLSGESSFDPDLGPSALSYTWTQTGGSPLTVSGLTSPVLTVTPTVAGVFSFTLQVGDGTATSKPIAVQLLVGEQSKRYVHLPLVLR